jgi:hypothetical protein
MVVKLNYILLILLCFTVACVGHNHDYDIGNNLPKKSLSLSDGFRSVYMGSSYDSFSHTALVVPCLSAATQKENISIASPVTMIDFRSPQRINVLQNELGIDVTSINGGGRFADDYAANFVKSVVNTINTDNILFMYKYAGKSLFNEGSIGGGESALSDYTREINKSDPNLFREVCGDSFVAEVDSGVLFSINLKLSFNSHYDQEKFNSNFNSSKELKNILDNIEKTSKISKVKVKLILQAIQVGGRPSELGEAIKSQDYSYINCGDVDSATYSSCRTVINDMLSYSTTLPAQIKMEDGKLHNLEYFNPIIMHYSDLGIKVKDQDPSEKIVEARSEMVKQYDKISYNYDFVHNYLNKLGTRMDTPSRILETL